jgi:hypothetical protein
MASPRRPAKQTSGWGGFLQQAVASVESKLDNILADEEDRPVKGSTSLVPNPENVASNKRETGLWQYVLELTPSLSRLSGSITKQFRRQGERSPAGASEPRHCEKEQ